MLLHRSTTVSSSYHHHHHCLYGQISLRFSSLVDNMNRGNCGAKCTGGQDSIPSCNSRILPLDPVASDCRISNRSKEPEPRSASNFALAAFTGCKRRRRFDLRSEQNANDTGTANCTSQQDRSIVRAHSEMKRESAHCKRLRRRRSNKNDAQGTPFSGHSKGLPEVKPFDLCLDGIRSFGISTGSSIEKNTTNLNEIGLAVASSEQRVLRPGMVLLKQYITHDEQVKIVKNCRDLGMGPGGFYQPGYQDGGKLCLQMMCLGLNWDPETRKYEDLRVVDGSEPPYIPHEFSLLVNRAILDAHALLKKEYQVSNVGDILPSMLPDICIANFYTTSGRLGLHQDRDESRESLRNGLPVVSFSVGDSAEFMYGDQRDVEKAQRVVLESGDVLIFGGKSRHIFHGVRSIIPKSAPKALLEETSLRPGRLNLTFRQF